MTQPRARAQTAAIATADQRRHLGSRRTEPFLVAAATVALIGAVACRDYDPNQGGSGNVKPPVVPDPRVCRIRGNDQWVNSGATVVTSTNTNTAGTTVINPCPFVIRDAKNYLDLGIVATIPKKASELTGIPIGTVNVFDVYRKIPIKPAFNGKFVTNDVIDSSRYRLELVNNGLTPGYYLNPANLTQMYDSIDVLIDNLEFGQAHGYRLMPGDIDPNKVSISGPSLVQTSTPGFYSVQTGYPVSAYAYRWTVDGTPVSGQNSSVLTYNWDTPGDHVVRVTVFRNDRTSETSSVVTTVSDACGGGRMC